MAEQCLGVGHVIDNSSKMQAAGVGCHAVFCTGRLLRAVQTGRLFPDSKTFVDMPLRTSPERVLVAFDELASTFAGTRFSLIQRRTYLICRV